MPTTYDAILVVGFGGPERPEDVIPFLENVTRGRNIPPERLREVAHHYDQCGGRSPLNDQVRALIGALRAELPRRGVHLPIFWGNRNWNPFLPEAVQQMVDAGVRRALGLVLAAYSSYSSCRQYIEDIARAQAEVGPQSPPVDKVRVFYNHPGFISANVQNLRLALDEIPLERRAGAHVAFTAHSIPLSMAANCRYEEELLETCRLVSHEIGIPEARWQLAYQSRSGRPSDPWIAPDIGDHLIALAAEGVRDVVAMPIGFLSDHMEVLYDLDVEALEQSRSLGLNLVRARTVGTHPDFVSALVDLIQERIDPSLPRQAIGRFGPNHDVCKFDCCPRVARPTGD